MGGEARRFHGRVSLNEWWQREQCLLSQSRMTALWIGDCL
jgi:hypothetical protein